MATTTISFSAEDDLFFQNNVEQLLPGFGSSYTDTCSAFPTPSTNNTYSMDGNDDCELLFELDNFVSLLNPNNEDCGFANLNPEMEIETPASATTLTPAVKQEIFLSMYDSDTTSSVDSDDSRNMENSQTYYNYNSVRAVKTELHAARAIKSVLGKRDAPFSFTDPTTTGSRISSGKNKKKKTRNPVVQVAVKTEMKMETKPRTPDTTRPMLSELSMRKQKTQNTPFVCTVAGCTCQAPKSKLKNNNTYTKKATTPRQIVVTTAAAAVIPSSASHSMSISAASQSSAFRGVSCCGRDRKWQARIRDRTVNRVRYLGRFVSQLDAAFEYDRHARTCKGSGAMTNFVLLTSENKELLSNTYTNLGYLPRNLFGLLGEGMESRMAVVLEQCLKATAENKLSPSSTLSFEPTLSPTNMVRVAGKSVPRSAVMSRSVFTSTA